MSEKDDVQKELPSGFGVPSLKKGLYPKIEGVKEGTPESNEFVQEEWDLLREIEKRYIEMQDKNEKLVRSRADKVLQSIQAEATFRKQVSSLEGTVQYLKERLQTSGQTVERLLLDKEHLLLRVDNLLNVVDENQLNRISDLVQKRKEET